MEHILKIFKHLARDILFYIVPGLALLANIVFIDFCLNDLSSFHCVMYISGIWFPGLLVGVSFILGHINASLMLLMYSLFLFCYRICLPLDNHSQESSEASKDIKVAENDYTNDPSFIQEVEIFAWSPIQYEQFIERDNLLARLRRMLATALFINCLSSIALLGFGRLDGIAFLATLEGISAGLLLWVGYQSNERLKKRIYLLSEFAKKNRNEH